MSVTPYTRPFQGFDKKIANSGEREHPKSETAWMRTRN